ncbi:dephospho-CoA kinase [Pantoea sp. AN62]|uniref:Dephospho-CoA kinase n=1 Tax=Pantoea brenneri TaxID=472694 RepID=A0ABU9MME3_9GAMM|nr:MULTISPECIES: dephospho-CoA kinase [Pantoea]MDU4745427.1 dephospho-CoA kinase [Pantoea sp.]KKD32251.1 dephospho-CoA kinase [Pantoea sp. 3.5.1]MCQ5470018.1 dephospho-CoA kinase [Pantoea brenneri]ORM61441.1 dephospho-CoA kinase [Pantoea brenneri]OXM25682.1 dephospho-CoA kinase [Pantoea sp. AV62]
MGNRPYTIALTGGIGSGKSSIARQFAALGVDIIDADLIAREVVEPGTPALQAIEARYGAAILTEQGTLNRARLREIIFQTPEEKSWLNALLHPLINARTQQLIAAASSPYVLWVVPLLVENQLQHQADRVLVIDVDEATQIARTQQRDQLSLAQVQRILAAQATRQQRLACADDIIDNSGEPEDALPQVAELHQRYLRLAATKQD